MRFSIILGALAASVMATPTMKRDSGLGGLLSPDVSQLNNVLAGAFGSLGGINGLVGSLSSVSSAVNVPGDLMGDTGLLMHNSQLELLSIANDLNNAMNALDLGSQAGVLSSSVDIVSGQVAQLAEDLTGIGSFYPDTNAVAGVQSAAGSVMDALSRLSSSIGPQ